MSSLQLPRYPVCNTGFVFHRINFLGMRDKSTVLVSRTIASCGTAHVAYTDNITDRRIPSIDCLALIEGAAAEQV